MNQQFSGIKNEKDDQFYEPNNGVLLEWMQPIYQMLRDPKKLVPWYNGTGVLLYVIGMMVSATGLGYF